MRHGRRYHGVHGDIGWRVSTEEGRLYLKQDGRVVFGIVDMRERRRREMEMG